MTARGSALRMFACDGPRWGLCALLGYTGASKALAVVNGVPLVAFHDVDGPGPRAFHATACAVAVLELALAIVLGLKASVRRVYPMVASLALSWAAALTAMWLAGWRIEYCGCFGPSLRLGLFDHTISIAATLALALGSIRIPRYLRRVAVARSSSNAEPPIEVSAKST